MRKANKILMSAVAILLCLVLISTSVVSGVFARFVVKRSAETSVGFTNFGVTVKMTPSDDLKSYMQSEVKTGESATLAFSGIKLRPGIDFSDAVKIKFEGTPNVKVKVSLFFHIEYNSSNTCDTKVPVGIGGNDNKDRYFMPLGFTFGANDKDGKEIIANDYVCPPWMNSKDKVPISTSEYTATVEHLEKAIRIAINKVKLDSSGDINVTMTDNGTDHGVAFTFDPNDSATKADVKANGVHFHPKGDQTKIIKEFELGFNWPEEYTVPNGKYNYDEIGTYLAQHKGDSTKPLKIWYIVKLEQVL